eukprot:TRINITY_DN48877_c0_g1_i1.p1 TRINITY_DN48877_c0_g1~~TRINITY_DN48877_c0_g1_i1.p1  ORF type:complete len:461 (+),score=53.43 TRINITY_DN48877_c0_g1_i1:145-1527(+)
MEQTSLEIEPYAALADRHSKIDYGFSANRKQVLVQLSIAALIGVTMRLVLFPEALLEGQKGPRGGNVDFLIFFGISKALSGLVGGTLADRWGRKKTSTLGWLCGVAMLPALVIGMYFRSRAMKNIADTLLGMHQGLTWGLNIICLMDIYGPDGRAMASGLSNALGYLGSALTAPICARLLELTGNETFSLIALAFAVAIALRLLAFSKDTSAWVEAEQLTSPNKEILPRQKGIACASEVQSLCSMGGCTVNTATGLVWGGAVLWCEQDGGLSVTDVGVMEGWHTILKVAALFFAGPAVDRFGAKVVAGVSLIVMAVGLGMLAVQVSSAPAKWPLLLLATGMIGFGVGGAFPALAASVSADAPTHARASVFGAYRMWRDLGYAVGGVCSHWFGSDHFQTTCLVVFCWSFIFAALFLVRLVVCPSLLGGSYSAMDVCVTVEMPTASVPEAVRGRGVQIGMSD